MKTKFLIIGATRSGATSIFKYLGNHPDKFMSEIKEINFFSNEKVLEKWLRLARTALFQRHRKKH